MKIGLIGAGGISRSHADAFVQKSDRFELAAVCDAQIETATALAKDFHPGSKVYADYRDVRGCDAVIICLPHFLHFPVASHFVEAGIPVLVEKPLVNSLDELRLLRDLAAARSVPVMVGQTRRFNVSTYELKRWIQAGNFGDLETFDLASYMNIRAYLRGQKTHWILDREFAGGGVVMSMAVHGLDWLRALTGHEYARVFAMGKRDQGPLQNQTEGTCLACLETTGGAQGSLHATMTLQKSPKMEMATLCGSLGSIREDQEGVRCATSRGETIDTWPAQFEGWTTVSDVPIPPLVENGFVNQLCAFADALESGTEPPSSLRENFNTLATAFSLYESMKTGKTVSVPTD